MKKLFVMNINGKLLKRQIDVLARKWNPTTKKDAEFKVKILNLLADISAQADGTVKPSLGITSRWKCDECGHEAGSVQFNDIVNGGVPMCADCDEEMALIGENIVLVHEDTSEILHQC
jgi:hypothetical protein